MLGISSQTRYQQQEIPIYLDDLIIILTDGVTEARNSEGTFIDKQKLLEYIKNINICTHKILFKLSMKQF